jgi:hypothetical protein
MLQCCTKTIAYIKTGRPPGLSQGQIPNQAMLDMYNKEDQRLL